jgi:hypothetical protein
MIVIEGMDATGKSTLARRLATELKLQIQESEGPPQSYSEFHARILRYFEMKDTHLFVRHPLVSNPIYDLARIQENHPIVKMPDDLYFAFYDIVRPTFIYCAPSSYQVDHNVKDHDSPEHLAMIERRRDTLLRGYSDWALKHAHIVYRIGDSTDAVLAMVRGRR